MEHTREREREREREIEGEVRSRLKVPNVDDNATFPSKESVRTPEYVGLTYDFMMVVLSVPAMTSRTH